MNFLPLLLGFMAYKMFSDKKQKPSGNADKANGNIFENLGNGILGEMLNNPEAMSSLGSVTKLFDKNATQEEKSTAVFSLLSNPAVFEIAKQFFMQNQQNGSNGNNGNGNVPSEESREYFRPVSNIAGVEISDKLCHLYDNWYIKKR